MRRDLIYIGQRFVVAFLLTLSLSSNGCSDSVSVSEDVRVPLASLVVTPGTLQPGFFSNTTSYKVNAPTSADSVTVTATPKGSTVEMTINGLVTTAGQGRAISLGTPGSITTITIVLFSQATGDETTYTIHVTRLLSSDDNLSALTVTPGTLAPAFTSDTLDYTVNVAATVTSVTVSATKSDPNAVMSGSLTAGAGVATGQATIPLGGPGTATPVTITVAAPNGTIKTYGITVNRLSSDNNLSNLSVLPGPLSPTFASNIMTYTVDVTNNVSQVTVTATKSDPNAVLSGSIADPGTGQATGQATISLGGPGTATPISITVTAPNGNSKTYSITVNRAAPSNNNNLSALTVIPGSLTPTFDSALLTYTVQVPTNVNGVTVTATLQNANATMEINGQGTSSGQPRDIALGTPGSSTGINILVIAPSGVQKTYTVTVQRAASNDSRLSGLTLSSGPTTLILNPAFDPNQLFYTTSVDNSVNAVVISATKSDPQATASVLGTVIAAPGISSGQVTVPLFGIFTEIVVTVISQDSTSETRYSITVIQSLIAPSP
ncbi:MAG: cadherin-like beta sandwich domain-containing protein [Nitrospira sp.]|nr:cadherin-like beta sandwich domain-containing protein [Nitrospira sp.]